MHTNERNLKPDLQGDFGAVLGIETSCDETGVALYHPKKGLLSHALYSQIALHAEYGGVVPELASRDHIRKIRPLVAETLRKAGLQPQDIAGIAYTAGPGLFGALLIGAAFGRSLAMAWGVPAVGVNHMEGHLMAPMLEANPPAFPFLALLVSGGHTQLVRVISFGEYALLGDSVDDAVGEAFDKTAKLLGLPYPGGAALSGLAQKGRSNKFHFPRPMLDRPGLDFSFSGLKTAAATTIAQTKLDDQARADIARGFEEAIIATLVEKSRRALSVTGLKRLVVTGGVGANLPLRRALQEMMAQLGGEVYFPRLEFCTDNGAMIAYVGCQRLLRGEADNLDIKIAARWEVGGELFLRLPLIRRFAPPSPARGEGTVG